MNIINDLKKANPDLRLKIALVWLAIAESFWILAIAVVDPHPFFLLGMWGFGSAAIAALAYQLATLRHTDFKTLYVKGETSRPFFTDCGFIPEHKNIKMMTKKWLKGGTEIKLVEYSKTELSDCFPYYPIHVVETGEQGYVADTDVVLPLK